MDVRIFVVILALCLLCGFMVGYAAAMSSKDLLDCNSVCDFELNGDHLFLYTNRGDYYELIKYRK